MKPYGGWMAAVGLAVSGWSAQMDAVKPTSVFSMEEVVITGTRIPQKRKEVATTVKVVSADRLTEEQPRDLGQALESEGSILVMRYGAPGALASTFVRGASSSQVLVMLDGRPLNHRGSGEVDISQIPMDNIERVEVVKGAASSMYGANALGGVVNLITRQHPAEEPRTQLTVEGGGMPDLEQNRTGWLQSYRVAHQQRVGDWDVNLGGGFQRSEGNRLNSVFAAYDVDANVGVQVSPDTELRLFGGFFKGDRGAPGSTTFSSPLALQLDERPFARVQMNAGWGEGRRVTGSVYWNNDHIIYRDPGSVFASDTDSYIRTIGSEWQVDVPWGADHVWSAGIQAYGDELTGQLGGVWLAPQRLSTIGTFLQDQIKLAEAWSVTANFRYDHHSIYGGAVSPQLGVLYEVTPQWRWRVSGGLAFRGPTLNDLYYPGFGNPALQPERAVSVDWGTEVEWGGGWSTRVTAFYSRVTDLIVFSFDPGTGGFLPLNVNKAHWTGGEVEWSGSLGGGFEWSGAFTYLLARDEATNLFLPRRPVNQLNTALGYRVGADLVRLAVRYQDLRYDNTTNTASSPSFAVVDAQVTHAWEGGLKTWVKMENVGDLTYEVILGYPMPRRTISVGTSVGF